MTRVGRTNVDIAVMIGLGVAGYFILKRILADAAVTVANAPANAVLTTGDALGVPRTDAEKCAMAKRSGDLWNQSVYCPASDFISPIFGANNYDPNA